MEMIIILWKGCLLQGIPAFRDFTIRDPRYFVIHFQWKIAKKVDFRNFFKVRFLLVRFFTNDRTIFPISTVFLAIVIATNLLLN